MGRGHSRNDLPAAPGGPEGQEVKVKAGQSLSHSLPPGPRRTQATGAGQGGQGGWGSPGQDLKASRSLPSSPHAHPNAHRQFEKASRPVSPRPTLPGASVTRAHRAQAGRSGSCDAGSIRSQGPLVCGFATSQPPPTPGHRISDKIACDPALGAREGTGMH